MVLRALDGTYAPGGRFFGTLAAASQPRFGGPTNPLNVCILVSLLATAFLAHFNAPTMYSQPEPQPERTLTPPLALTTLTLTLTLTLALALALILDLALALILTRYSP